MATNSTGSISRRQFVGTAAAMGAAAGAVTLASQPAHAQEAAAGSATSDLSWLPDAPEIDASAIAETYEADVVVVGAGLSGFSVACSAIDEGLSVIMIAKGERSAGSGGSMFGFGSKLCQELGVDPDPCVVLKRLYELSSHNVDERLWSIFVKESGAALDWACDIAEQGGLTPVIAASEPAESFGEYNGEHMFLGGENGPRTDTHPIIDYLPIMEEMYKAKGLDVRYQTTAVKLEKDGSGRVTTVIATDVDGNYLAFAGTRAVVMATGDFAGNQEMLEALCPLGSNPNILNVSPRNTGDGHILCLQAGGALEYTQPIPP